MKHKLRALEVWTSRYCKTLFTGLHKLHDGLVFRGIPWSRVRVRVRIVAYCRVMVLVFAES